MGALSAAVKNLHESAEHQGILPLSPHSLFRALSSIPPLLLSHLQALYFGICGLESSQVSLISSLGTVCSWTHICERS